MNTNTTTGTTRKPPRRRLAQTMVIVAGAAATGLLALPALSASASPASAKPAAAATANILPGNYTLHFSWGCTGHYGDVVDTFNAGGTLSSGGVVVGKWVQQDGTVMWEYTTGPAKYGGTMTGPVGAGVSSTFAGLNGCWYLTAQGITGGPAHSAGHQPSQAGGR
jgi:hypothetical protein